MITTKKAAAHLKVISTLLEVVGEGPKRVKSFSFAARSLEDFTGTLAEAIGAARDKKIRGVTEQLIVILEQLHDTESSDVYEKLVDEVTPEFLEILQLRGIGAKKAKALREEANVSSLDELELACKDGSLIPIKGFGKKTIVSILEAISFYRERRGFVRLHEAFNLEGVISKTLEKDGAKMHPTGELRRGAEILNKCTIVSTNTDVEKIESALRGALVRAKISSQDEVSTAELDSGLLIEVKNVGNSDYFKSIFYNSCSSVHYDHLCSRANYLGKTLESICSSISAESLDEFEKGVYSALGLPNIPAELREDLDLPSLSTILEKGELVQLSDLSGIVHVHTNYSDGTASLEQMANYVNEQGFHYLGISDHSRSAAYAGGLSIEKIKRQHEEIDQLNEDLSPFRVLKGIESDILSDGSLDYPEAVLEQFDFIVASLHSGLTMRKDEMTTRLKRAIENPFTTSIGHITTRKLLQRPEAEMELEELILHAAKHDVAIEINANPIRLDLPYRLHQMAIEHGVKLPICPDAHSLEGIHDIRYGVIAARKGGLRKSDIPTAWPVREAVAYWSK